MIGWAVAKRRKKTPAKPVVYFDTRVRETFLAHFRLTGRVQESADVAGVARCTVHRVRKEDPVFSELYDDAHNQFRDKLEAEAYARAVDGWEEPVFQMGGEVGRVLKKSDRMLELMLKGHIPERYRDKAAAEFNVSGGVLVVGGQTTPDEWAARTGGGDDE